MTRKSGFQCKQFFIEHAMCAMKVGTDGLMLGSWTNCDDAQRILDIGTGSGLLALMLAQKSGDRAEIMGIDINDAAIQQAQLNADSSPWSAKLSFTHVAVQDYRPQNTFDLIISNPPFFPQKKGELASSDANFIESSRRQARHTISLSYQQLAENVARLLSSDGKFDCILPQNESAQFIPLMRQHGLTCEKRLTVKTVPSGEIKRSLMRFSTADLQTQNSSINIYDQHKQYSAEYKKLCKDFYLHF